MSAWRGRAPPAGSGELLLLPRARTAAVQSRPCARSSPACPSGAPFPRRAQPRHQIVHFEQLTEILLQVQTLDPKGLARISVCRPLEKNRLSPSSFAEEGNCSSASRRRVGGPAAGSGPPGGSEDEGGWGGDRPGLRPGLGSLVCRSARSRELSGARECRSLCRTRPPPQGP